MRSAIDPARYNFVPGATGPLVVGGEGSYLLTADGRRILDAAGGAIVANIGHGRSEVADAVRDAMANGGYTVPIWPTPHRLELLDRLTHDWLPDGFEHVFFTSGGSESADSAIRLARAYQLSVGRPERWKVVGRHPSYHGMTLGSLAMGSHSSRRAGYEPLLLEFPKVPWDDADAVVRLIEQEDPATIAGFVFEPVTGAAGACLVASDRYWRTVEEVCRAHDIVLIADEVMTGFGRCGTRWGHEQFPITPDVIYGGKGLGGGYVPIGMLATTARIADPLARVGAFMFFTFTGNDGACAGASKVLEILTSEALVERSARMGALLGERLHDALDDHPNVLEVRGRGLFQGIELVHDRGSERRYPAEAQVATAVSRRCLEQDVWVYPAGSGPVQDALMLGCPFIITDEEIDRIVSTLRDGIDVICGVV